jgi:hypothetical protein
MMPPRPHPPAVPDMADTCAEIAEAFSRLSRDAYRDGDEARGDRLFAKSLAWALAAEEGKLPEQRLP